MLPRAPNAPGFWVLGPDTDLVANHSGLESYFGTGDGVIVLRVDADNPMRLEDGDVILTLDREPVESPVDLARKLMQRPGGERVALEVMRDGVLTEVGGTIPQRSGPLGRLHRFSNPLEPAPVAPRPPAVLPRAL
jgi:S1-C subfamily serine protease